MGAGAATNVATVRDGAPKKSCRLDVPWVDARAPPSEEMADGIGLITRRPAWVPGGTGRHARVLILSYRRCGRQWLQMLWKRP
jgi:hypothetical protein